MVVRSKVGNYVQIPNVLYPLWQINHPRYAGLLPYDFFVLWLLLKSLGAGNNGELSLSVGDAESFGVSKDKRRASLNRLKSAGLILRMARNRGSIPEKFAVFWRPFKTNDIELSLMQETFDIWATEQREKYRCDFEEIPDYFKPIVKENASNDDACKDGE